MGFVENVNLLTTKLDIIEESNEIFDDGVIPVLKEIAALDLYEAIQDLRKGNYLGNRKIDINLALNVQGISQDLIDKTPVVAEAIWTDSTKTVLYDRATATFVDGTVIELPFIFDGNPTTISTHADLLAQLSRLDIIAGVPAETAFLQKLAHTLISSFAYPVVGEIIRAYDVIGQNSNLERLELHVHSGPANDLNPVYFWAKTTSAFQTLSMRAGDIIKLGNDIDKIIVLSARINEMLALQAKLPELVDNPDSLYINIDKLVELHENILAHNTIYDDIKVGGNNYIQRAVANEANINAAVANETNINSIVDNVVPIIPEILAAENHALTATDKAQEASDYVDEITGLSTQVLQLASSQPATSFYNSTTGVLTLGIPQGLKGDRGEAFKISAQGTFANRVNYNGSASGFSYFATDLELLYFKTTDVEGDFWTAGSEFGKGDKGDKGDTGNSIVSISFTSTTDVSGNAGKSGATDTYTIAYTETAPETISVYNGKDSAVMSVAGKSGDVVLDTNDINGLVDELSIAKGNAVAMAVVFG